MFIEAVFLQESQIDGQHTLISSANLQGKNILGEKE